MLPFDSLSDSVLAKVVGIASDIDDTITAHGVLSPASLDALCALQGAGVPCVLVTGRPLGWAEVLVRLLPVRAVVTENGGAWVVREDDQLRVAFLEDEKKTRSAGMVRVQRHVEQLVQIFPELRRVADLTLRATDVALDIGESVKVSEETVSRAVELVRREGLYPVVSSVHLHVSARVPDKSAGLRGAVRDLGLDPTAVASRWLYIGDSPNDAGAFAAMALSVGIASVRAFEGRMPAWPAYVVEGGSGVGFAEVAQRFLAARRSGA